jgi:dCMP deaminase
MGEVKRTRLGLDEYFMNITKVVAKRSTCRHLAVGAIVVKDKRILATGYNGAPKGLDHCLDVGCLIKKVEDGSGGLKEQCVRTVHAEQNAIIQAAIHGVNVEGATLYTTHAPCLICTKMIINAGIKRVVYANVYPDEFSRRMFKAAGIPLEIVDTEKSGT